jgi:hypothetical protein
VGTKQYRKARPYNLMLLKEELIAQLSLMRKHSRIPKIQLQQAHHLKNMLRESEGVLHVDFI